MELDFERLTEGFLDIQPLASGMEDLKRCEEAVLTKIQKTLADVKDEIVAEKDKLRHLEKFKKNINEKYDSARTEKAQIKQRLLDAEKQLHLLITQGKKITEDEATPVAFSEAKTLSYIRSLYYAISYIAWKKTADKNIAEGYVINPLNNRLTNFSFDDTETSLNDIQNYLWDHIAAGLSPKWNI